MAILSLNGQSALGKKSIFGETLSLIVALKDKIDLRWKCYLHYQQITEELEMYTDRQLADIGVARHDIRRLARESAQLMLKAGA